MMAAFRFGDGTALKDGGPLWIGDHSALGEPSGMGDPSGRGDPSGKGTPLDRGPLRFGGTFWDGDPSETGDRSGLGSSQTNHLEHMTSPSRSPCCLLPAHPRMQTLAGGGQVDLSHSCRPVWVPHPSTWLRRRLDLGAPFISGEAAGAPRTCAHKPCFPHSD